MMWHGFMFGNNWQPDTYDFKQNVEKEAGDQLVRLRNRPSTVLLRGNKETEEATNWRSRDKLDDLTRLHIWGWRGRISPRRSISRPCTPRSTS